jgi:hypothetical protein
MLTKILFVLLGLFIFLFAFWKRLKEDYLSAQIFSTSLYILLGILLGNMISFKFFPDWWFWLSMAGIVIGFSIGIIKYRLKFFETTEALVISSLPGFSLILLDDSMNSSNPVSFVGFLIILLLILSFLFLDAHYKKFTWYKSGKIGFSGFTILGLFFLIRAAIASAFPNVLSFAGKPDIYLSAMIAFVSFLIVFNLSRQQI